MDILPTPTTPSLPPAQVAAGDGASSVLSSDFETFLTMLTAQAKYQDPLEPIDSTEYASQLAQFSGVEQQVKSNDLLSALVSQMGNSNMAEFAGWIGMEARTTAPAFFDGAPITVIPSPASVAEDVAMIVRDSNGTEVQRIALDTSGDPVQWAGVDASGSPFPSGAYTFEIESSAQGEVVGTSSGETYGRITEARRDDGTTKLILESGATISAESVLALREPA